MSKLDIITKQEDSSQTESVWAAVLVLNGFSMLSLGAIVGPLSLWSSHLSPVHYSFRLVGIHDGFAEAENGTEIRCDWTLSDLESTFLKTNRPKKIFVCGPTNRLKSHQPISGVLRRATRAGAEIHAIGAIVGYLVDAGVLPEGSLSLHWGKIASFNETHSHLDANDHIFSLENGFSSSPGELATLDLVLSILRQENPAAMEIIKNQLMVNSVRSKDTRQPGALSNQIMHFPKKLRKAIDFMSEEIEDPAPIGEIAVRSGCSSRQLERLFRLHLDRSPKDYYMSIRLERAMELVTETQLDFHQIAAATGFASPSVLHKKFKKKYVKSPTQVREALAMVQPQILVEKS